MKAQMTRVVGAPAEEDLRSAVEAAVNTDGVASVARRIGISVTTVLRIMARARVQPGSLLMVRRGLQLDDKVGR